jgi:cytoskeletal protein RodZ
LVTTGVGETLRNERVRKQRSIEEIAAATRISQRFLQAIEVENFSAIPGLVFARNFVRQYAVSLELDPAPLLAMMPQMDMESVPLPQPPNRQRKPMWDPRWNSTFASVAWTLLAVGAAVGAYIHFNRSQHREAVAVAAPAPAPIQAPIKPAAIEPVAIEPAAPPAVPTETPVTPPTTVPEHAVAVLVTARLDSWVSASADGRILFATTLKAGENRSVSADQLVKIRTGNAGGIDLTLNGKPLDSLGPVGQIRTVTLTAEGLLPAPAPPAPQTPPVEP